MIKKRILVAVMNWGLGHASRSIPIIHEALNKGFEPVLASDGEALQLLRREFPGLQAYELPSYSITYPNKGAGFRLHFLLKTPRMFKALQKEHRIVEELIRREKISGLISDNRFGAYSKKVSSVYLTHQVNVLSGRTSFLSSSVHRYFIRKFNECWIPDIEKSDESPITGRGSSEPLPAAKEYPRSTSSPKNLPKNLSGRLGHGFSLPVPHRYLGIWSRLRKKDLPQKYDLMVLLSGPEPQRTFLEEILLRELQDFEGKVLFISGRLGTAQKKEQEEAVHLKNKDNWELHKFLSGESLENALNQSRLVLARSGYSTLLDLAVLEKKAFLIPTPGQFEQEYLAQRMESLRIAPSCHQEDFTADKLEQVGSYTGFIDFSTTSFPKDLFRFIQKERIDN